MLHGNRIEHCPFIPFVIPHAKSVDYRKISKILKFEDQKPHLIYLANSTFEEPPYVESVIIHVLYFRSYKEPKSTYFDFLDLSFEIIANYPNNKIPFIGVASRSTPDFCEFFIARWLINECGFTMNESLELVRSSLPPGIIKKKFLDQLSKLMFKFEKISRTNTSLTNSDQNNENNKLVEVSSQKESENRIKESTIPNTQSSITINNNQNQIEIYKNTDTEENIKNAKFTENHIYTPSNEAKTNSSITPTQNYDQQLQDQHIQTLVKIEEPLKRQEKQPISELESSSDVYKQQQNQFQMQQRQQQQQLKTLQDKAHEYILYQNQVKQLLLEFQSSPYDYQQQNINYQYQLQSNLQEVAVRLQSVELQIQQIQAAQQQSSTKVTKQAAPIQHADIENEKINQIQQDEQEYININPDLSTSGSINKIQTVHQSQPQVIEQPVPPQHATMYFSEIEKMMNMPHQKYLFTKFIPLTLSQLEKIKNRIIASKNEKDNTENESLTYCLMPEPKGIRAILYLRRKIPILMFQNYSPIQLKLDINTNDDDLYIFEVILVRYCQSNIVLCDILYERDKDVSSQPFNHRIGIVKNCYEKIFKQLNSAAIKFTVRPFYRLKDYNVLTDLFESKPHKHFTRYPLAGISATLINSGNCHSSKCMFLWTKNVIENPRVIIDIDFGSKSVIGYAQSGTTSAKIAYLGKLTPDMFDLNGKVVEIEILDQDPTWRYHLNAKIIKPSDDYPWTTNKFMKYYPDREPHMDVQALSSMLETIASIS